VAERQTQSRRLEEQGKLIGGERSYHKPPIGAMAVGSYLARWESGRIQFYKELCQMDSEKSRRYK